jgi:protein tyrosine/serine phosphatase
LSSDKAPSSGEIEELLGLFHDAPRPVPIYCKAGADRSGLAAAIWKIVIDGKPKPEAEKQLSFVYGRIPFGPIQVLDEFFEKWVIPTEARVMLKR